MGEKSNWDFSGYATKNDVRCADGRTIRQGAFSHQNGDIVPIVYQHSHDDIMTVVGHGMLEDRDDGVYMYGSLNSTEQGQHAKECIRHGDIVAMSIYANRLKQTREGDVLHGTIREVSLVLAGANPCALIDRPIIAHSDDDPNDVLIAYFNQPLECASEDVQHSDEDAEGADDNVQDASDSKPEEEESTVEKNESNNEEEMEHADMPKDSEKTFEDVMKTLNEEQKEAFAFLLSKALELKHSDEEENDGGNEEMSHNVFDKEEKNTEVLCHEAMELIIKDAKRCGGMRDSYIEHADDLATEYGIENIGYLFSDAKTMSTTPETLKRDDSWVGEFLNNVHHTPFSRVKSVFFDITAEEARARGYLKGNLKMEEVITLLKRVTQACTIYKKQKLDRDDIIEITDFDVVAYLKTEMRAMLNEEIARAALLGDGRSAASEDKISELNVRPIWTDSELFTINQVIELPSNATADQRAKAFIRACVKSRKNYKGSGNPVLFTTEDQVTDCLLLEDNNGRVIYDTMDKLTTALRVRKIVTVPVMEGQVRSVDGANRYLMGIIVNPYDYNIGADKGGSINMFEDFDIDYNQEKYLIETRISGALTKPYSAIAVEMKYSA